MPDTIASLTGQAERARPYQRAGRVVALAALSLLATHAAPTAATAANKQAKAWASQTKVEKAAQKAAVTGSDANPMCAQVSANIGKHVSTIKALQASYEKSASQPPQTVKAALEGWFGTREPSAEMREAERKMVAERKAADELNVTMQSMNCARLNIDELLASRTVEQLKAPTAPKTLSDELVRTPNRY